MTPPRGKILEARPGAGPTDRTDIARRMSALGLEPELVKDPQEPRWTVRGRWVEFECGCRAERCARLVEPREWDPIIFPGLPQQAVYDHVCHRHAAGMNARCHFGGFADFGQWRRARRDRLMGRTRKVGR